VAGKCPTSLCCVVLCWSCVVLSCCVVLSYVVLSWCCLCCPCLAFSCLAFSCLAFSCLAFSCLALWLPIPQPTLISLYRLSCLLPTLCPCVSHASCCVSASFHFCHLSLEEQQSSASFRDGEKVDAMKYLPPKSRTNFCFPAPLFVCLSFICHFCLL
jgi:hypothetical protein